MEKDNQVFRAELETESPSNRLDIYSRFTVFQRTRHFKWNNVRAQQDSGCSPSPAFGPLVRWAPHCISHNSLVFGSDLPLGPQPLLFQCIQSPLEGSRLLDIAQCLHLRRSVSICTGAVSYARYLRGPLCSDLLSMNGRARKSAQSTSSLTCF
jgi:hypothetical protein